MREIMTISSMTQVSCLHEEQIQTNKVRYYYYYYEASVSVLQLMCVKTEFLSIFKVAQKNGLAIVQGL